MRRNQLCLLPTYTHGKGQPALRSSSQKSQTHKFPIKKGHTYPHPVHFFTFHVEGFVNTRHIKNWVLPYAVQKVFGEVAYVVFFEVPLHQYSGRNGRLGIAVAAVTKVFPQVVTIAESPDIFCRQIAMRL